MITNSFYAKYSSMGYEFVNNALPEEVCMLYKKVKEFSENYIVNCVAKALIVSTALSYFGLSPATTFPICFVVITVMPMVSELRNLVSKVKEAVNKIIDSAKWLADKSTYYLIQTAQTIAAIVKKIWEWISYYSSGTIDFIKEPSFSVPNKRLQINNPLVSETEPFIEETATPFFSSPSSQATTTIEKSADLYTCAIERTPQIKEDSSSMNQTHEEQTPLIKKLTQRSMNFEKPCVLDLEASLKEIQQVSDSYLKWTALFNEIFVQPAAKIETQKFKKPFQHVQQCNPLYLEISAQSTENQKFRPPPKSPTINSQIKLTTNALRYAKFLVK